MNYKVFESSDTNVKKFVFEWEANGFGVRNAVVEAVLYRYGSYSERTVICCSVQSGCPVGCAFCGTGKFFARNLYAHEIIEQVDFVLSTIDCKTSDIKKFQIMFMSMGEPFLNYFHLELAIKKLHEKYPNAQLLVSTSAPAGIEKHISDFISLSREIDKVGLQFTKVLTRIATNLFRLRLALLDRLQQSAMYGQPSQAESLSITTAYTKATILLRTLRGSANSLTLEYGKPHSQ